MARNPAIRAFVTGWADAWREVPDVAQSLYAATCTHDGAHGVVLHRERQALVLNSDEATLPELVDDLLDAGRSVRHVIGEEAPCAAFASAWCARARCTARRGMHLRHHMLTRLEGVLLSPGLMRAATDDDWLWLLAGCVAFAGEARLPDSAQQVEASARRRFARGGFRIWNDTAPVAFAGCAGIGDAARIGMVYTAPQWRRRGYATSLVCAIVRERLDAGAARIFLVTDVDNPTSNAIYARIGFRPVSDEVRVDFTDAPA
ncbi:MAG TPA: GNAT family N-acetyltransferase [Casimicrobiaceae bacterium]